MRTIIRGVWAEVFLALIAWIALLAGISLLTDQAPARLVIFPSKAFLENLSPEAKLVDLGRWSVTLASEERQLTWALYAQGALLVLPARLPGCGRTL